MGEVVGVGSIVAAGYVSAAVDVVADACKFSGVFGRSVRSISCGGVL